MPKVNQAEDLIKKATLKGILRRKENLIRKICSDKKENWNEVSKDR